MRVGNYKLHTKRHLIGLSLIGGIIYFTLSPNELSDTVNSGLRNLYSRIESLNESKESYKENYNLLEKITNENSN